jgi:hypothetical protein
MQWAMDHVPMALLRPFMMKFLTTMLALSPALFDDGARLVNRHGDRFGDERDRPAWRLPDQPGKVGWILIDDTRRYAVRVLSSSLRMRMSSIMRWRSGEMASDDGFMILLLLRSEADCLAAQRWQERGIERQPTLPERLPRERFSPQTDCSRSSLAGQCPLPLKADVGFFRCESARPPHDGACPAAYAATRGGGGLAHPVSYKHSKMPIKRVTQSVPSRPAGPTPVAFCTGMV